ncbi:P-loop NTPase family protein, partial [Singulisphaera rosea]
MRRKVDALFSCTSAYVRRIFQRPTRRGIRRESFPQLEYLATLGIIVGALVAGGYAAATGLGLKAILGRALLGALAAGIFGTFLGMIRTSDSDSEPAAEPEDGSPSDESNTLWDRWVDDSEDSGSVSDAVFLEEDEGVPPHRARVRPRMLSTASGESMPLEDEIRSVVKSGVKGLVRIVGSHGSGKSTTLRHLQSQIHPHPGVLFLDDPSHQEILAASAMPLVIYTSPQPFPRKHVATYRLAPWSQDDLIEYLLATDAASCPSVMSRIQDSGDLGFLQGIPELWSTALDRMVQEPSGGSARDALRGEILHRLPDAKVAGKVQERCFLTIVAASRTAPGELAFNPSWPVE